jgi:actin-related protein
VTEYLLQMVRKAGYSFTISNDEALRLCNHMKIAVCRVGSEDSCLYELPDGQKISLSAECVNAPEVMFDPRLHHPFGADEVEGESIASQSRHVWTLAAKHHFGIVKDIRKLGFFGFCVFFFFLFVSHFFSKVLRSCHFGPRKLNDCGLQHLTLESILRCDAELRTDLVKNIVVSGGNQT